MTTKVTVEVFQEIDVEHRELEQQYAAFDAMLDSNSVRVPILRRRLKELAAILKCHFEHEEEEGYFKQVVEIAPRLSHRAEQLESEHDALLRRLDHLDEQLSTTVGDEFAMLRQEFCQFIEACRAHEQGETALVQEAWLTEIGEGD
jgi:hypothetical protein